MAGKLDYVEQLATVAGRSWWANWSLRNASTCSRRIAETSRGIPRAQERC